MAKIQSGIKFQGCDLHGLQFIGDVCQSSFSIFVVKSDNSACHKNVS